MTQPDARTEAAARAMQHDFLGSWDEMGEMRQDQLRRIAANVLAAADAVDAPLAEKLAEALRLARQELLDIRTGMNWGSGPAGASVRYINDALREFDAARGDSQGTATKEDA